MALEIVEEPAARAVVEDPVGLLTAAEAGDTVLMACQLNLEDMMG